MESQSFRARNTKTRCTCGCNKDVSFSTKQRHLRGLSKPELAAKVLEHSRDLHGEGVGKANNSSNKRPCSESPNHGSEDQHQKQACTSFPNAAEMIEMDPISILAAEAIVELSPEIDGGEEDKENGVSKDSDNDDLESNLDHGTEMESHADEEHEKHKENKEHEEHEPKDDPNSSEESYWDLIDDNFWRSSPEDALDNRDANLLRHYLKFFLDSLTIHSKILKSPYKDLTAISPCQICSIKAIHGTSSKNYYVPLHRDQSDPIHYIPSNIPIWMQDKLMAQAKAVERAPNDATFKRLSQEYGIKGTFILRTRHQDQAYVISPANWAAIGKATAESKATIPSGFGAPPPNVATQRSQMTSEMYCNWTLFIVPIVLRGKFSNPAYYRHFMDLVGLLKLCLALEIDGEEMERVDRGFETWVKDYEKLYYQHKPERLLACPLTVHVLLHIGWSIRTMGPVWTYWAFPMERHCNLLLTSIGSQRHPYASMNAFVTATAQLVQIRLKFDAHQILCLKPPEKFRGTVAQKTVPMFQGLALFVL
ncbi:hypothetical protein AGABI2DRAFT_143728 [Agaricus bisporus var. bisporus H97]|uniref:hypothetical protein n=1 Tax=Agaricus bisporus var. bisporus (strain H97 / ATCC MYA-4626 / FGSC 10389) TaxID=936046 RepID=UPI00029F58FC|nr:hypothetical protein AGABI2DRAFT_143728 [Agaricus bisporus var. bisporus H97]EKV46698.1 hypothetical protein AGABI2DRAFT_143728 [Agaricus bisporus var. bisporus H97]